MAMRRVEEDVINQGWITLQEAVELRSTVQYAGRKS